MRLRQLALAALLLLVPAAAHAGGGGTALWGYYPRVLGVQTQRLSVFGSLGLGDNDDEALFLVYGKGLTKNIDFQGTLGLHDGAQSFGGGVNYQALSLMKSQQLDVTVGGGFTYTNFDGGHNTSVDVAVAVGKPVNDRFSWYGALTIGFGNSSNDYLDDLGVDYDGGFTSAHLVPGLKYVINDKWDFLAEFGIGVTDDAGEYLAGGLHYYFKGK